MCLLWLAPVASGAIFNVDTPRVVRGAGCRSEYTGTHTGPTMIPQDSHGAGVLDTKYSGWCELYRVRYLPFIALRLAGK